MNEQQLDAFYSLRSDLLQEIDNLVSPRLVVIPFYMPDYEAADMKIRFTIAIFGPRENAPDRKFEHDRIDNFRADRTYRIHDAFCPRLRGGVWGMTGGGALVAGDEQQIESVALSDLCVEDLVSLVRLLHVVRWEADRPAESTPSDDLAAATDPNGWIPVARALPPPGAHYTWWDSEYMEARPKGYFLTSRQRVQFPDERFSTPFERMTHWRPEILPPESALAELERTGMAPINGPVSPGDTQP